MCLTYAVKVGIRVPETEAIICFGAMYPPKPPYPEYTSIWHHCPLMLEMEYALTPKAVYAIQDEHYSWYPRGYHRLFSKHAVERYLQSVSDRVRVSDCKIMACHLWGDVTIGLQGRELCFVGSCVRVLREV